MDVSVVQLNNIIEYWEECVFLESIDGTILTWNMGAKNLYGFPANEIIGKKHNALVPPEIEDNPSDQLANFKIGLKTKSYEVSHRKKDGSIISVTLTVTPIRNEQNEVTVLAIFVKNLTEGEQAKVLFSALTRSSPIGIYIIHDGKFQYINHRFEEIIGYTISELMNTDSLLYIYPEDKELVRNHAVNALKSGYSQPYEFRVLTKSGQLKWVLETVMSIKYHGKRAALGNLMDRTESKQLEEQKRQMNEKLILMVKKLEDSSHRNAIMSEMRDLLQACSKIEETPPVIVGAMVKLFPKSSGALFLLNNSRSDMESTARWGEFPPDTDDNIFPLDACWGLRLGRAHVVEDMTIGPVCQHLKHKPANAYVCLPLMAKGDILGLLNLQIGKVTRDIGEEIADLKDIANTLSEYLSLSIANVKLGESLAKQSIQDPLSGLFNRRFMEESLQREILRAKRNKSTIGIIMADLDNFKRFNDVYGHAAGDKIISSVGRILREKTRGSDIACRYGGEEFVLILPESLAEDTFKHANALREEVKGMEIIFQGQVVGTITISMGLASYPEHGTQPDELLRVADLALYKAKQAGKDRIFTG